MARGRLFLIDASGYVYRAFHALPALNTSRGLPTNATLGFANMVAKLLRGGGERDYLAVVFDAPGGTFRDALYADYKQQRPPMPDDLRPQLPYIRKLVTALRLPVIEQPGVEADDVIGTLATRAAADDLDTVIVTADKDMMQLVNERTTLYDDVRNRRIGIPEVRERFGVDPERVADVLGLMGDTIDNIPGVTGIGQKTASALVQHLGPVDAILARLDEVEQCGIRGAKKIRETLTTEADVARLSTQLATIQRDVPLDVEWEQLRWHGPDVPALRPLLMELEFMALLRELAPTGPAATVEVERREAASPAEVAGVVAALAKEPAVSVFAVLDSPRATSAGFTAIVLGGPSGPPVVLTTPEAPETLTAIAPLLGDFAVAKLGDDLKTLRVALARRRIGLAGPAMDFGLASYCLNPSQPTHDAGTLAHLLLGEPAVPGGDPVDAACRAARVARALRPVVEERLARVEMQTLYRELEMPLAEVLADMELAGVALDTAALAAMSTEFGGALERVVGEIYALAGGEFNIGSPVQLREVLFDRLKLSTKNVKRTKTGLSTDVDVLTRLAAEHPLPAKILEYRQIQKLKSTYVDALPALMDPSGRIHTSFNQTVAATGRLSSSDPNLQNIPIRTEEGRRIRAAFVAGPGCRLVSADYSQIELRVLAHLSNDAALIDAFTRGDDIHARTAADVFGALSPADGRRLAKVINYGIVYGMGPARAARELGVSMKEAETYIRDYFARYAGVRTFLDATVTEARERGYVTTVLGRRRYLPELGARDPGVRQFAERAATNTPIQGSAADLIKLAMLEVRRRLQEAGSRAHMLLQVHDELVFEVPDAEVDAVCRLVREAMEGVRALRVPLRVDVRSGANWSEAH
jgi:DNA polymerase-1